MDKMPESAWKQLSLLPGGSAVEGLRRQSVPGRTYVAGGAIRDCLISGRTPSADLDVFCLRTELGVVLDAFSEVGTLSRGPFGSRRIDCDKGHVDVIVIEEFDNGLWPCSDMVDVLNQFDLTVNCVAVDVADGRLLIEQNARRDMRERAIRAVRFDFPDEPISDGSPLTRLGVLWFRIGRYANQLEYDVEPITAAWMKEYENLARQQGRDYERVFGDPSARERESDG